MKLTDEDKKALDALLQQCVDRLSEVCDSVQILVTAPNYGGTFSAKKGSGNWYARVGMAREFILSDAAMTHFDEAPKEPPETDEGWKAA